MKLWDSFSSDAITMFATKPSDSDCESLYESVFGSKTFRNTFRMCNIRKWFRERLNYHIHLSRTNSELFRQLRKRIFVCYSEKSAIKQKKMKIIKKLIFQFIPTSGGNIDFHTSIGVHRNGNCFWPIQFCSRHRLRRRLLRRRRYQLFDYCLKIYNPFFRW